MSQGWTRPNVSLPATMMPVLVAYGRDGKPFGYTVAAYVRALSVESDGADDAMLDTLEFSDYDENTDTFYWPAGWYERQSANPAYTHLPMTEDVIAWMYLPGWPKK